MFERPDKSDKPEWEREEVETPWTPSLEKAKEEIAEFEEKIGLLPENIADLVRRERNLLVNLVSDLTGKKGEYEEFALPVYRNDVRKITNAPESYYRDEIEKLEWLMSERVSRGEQIEAKIQARAEMCATILRAFKETKQ
jgi:hypothetical protein